MDKIGGIVSLGIIIGIIYAVFFYFPLGASVVLFLLFASATFSGFM